MRGDNVMMGYLDDEESTREAFKGGWFHSGDLGVVHEDGYVELRDRLKDVIISGGENIATIEVEQALAAHDSVTEAAVVAAPARALGRGPGRVRHASPATSPTSRSCRSSRASGSRRFKVPKRIDLRRRAAQDRHRQDPEVRPPRAGGRGRREGIDCAAVYAAVLHEYGEAPRYEDVADPSPEAGQVVVEVAAAALHHLDLFKASGNFYLEQPLPSVVGTDGVGVAGGRRVYFDAVAPHGSMAERAVAAEEELFDVPDALDDPTAAAIANSGLAGWLALSLARGPAARRDGGRARRHRPGRHRRRAGGEAAGRRPRDRGRARGRAPRPDARARRRRGRRRRGRRPHRAPPRGRGRRHRRDDRQPVGRARRRRDGRRRALRPPRPGGPARRPQPRPLRARDPLEVARRARLHGPAPGGRDPRRGLHAARRARRPRRHRHRLRAHPARRRRERLGAPAHAARARSWSSSRKETHEQRRPPRRHRPDHERRPRHPARGGRPRRRRQDRRRSAPGSRRRRARRRSTPPTASSCRA